MSKKRIMSLPIEQMPLGQKKVNARNVKVLVENDGQINSSKRIAIINEKVNKAIVFDSENEFGIIDVESVQDIDGKPIFWIASGDVGVLNSLGEEDLLHSEPPLDQLMIDTIKIICDAEQQNEKNDLILAVDILILAIHYIERYP